MATDINALVADKDFQAEVAAVSQLDTPTDRLLETTDALGIGFKIGDIEFPPPCAGVVFLLETVGSPFVLGLDDGEDLTREKVIQALYICFEREKALAPVHAAIRARRALEATADTAKTSAQHYQVFLDSMVVASSLWAAFDQGATAFGMRLGAFSWEDAAEQVHGYLRRCTVGYRMFPGTGKPEDEKKKTVSRSLIANGLPQELSLYQRLVHSILRLK